MKDEKKTKAQLLAEIASLRQQIDYPKTSKLAREKTIKIEDIIETMADGLLLLAFDGTVTFINKALESLSGYQRHEVLEKHFSALVPLLIKEEELETALITTEKALTEANTPQLAITLMTKDGQEVPVVCNASIVQSSEENEQYLVVTFRDVTMYKQAERALQKAHDELEQRVKERTGELLQANNRLEREITDRLSAEKALQKSEQMYRFYFENINDLICSTNSAFRITNISPSIEPLLGYKPEELMGKTFSEISLWTPEELERISWDTEQLLAGGKVPAKEYELIAKNGTKKFFDVRGTLLTSEQDDISIITVARDITDRKHLEKEILEISEKEKREIGLELHDGLGQLLTGVSFMSKRLEDDLTEKDLKEAVDAAKITRLIAESIAQTRDIAKGLCPVDLSAGGLIDALERLSDNISETFNVSCRFVQDPPVLLFDSTRALHLYRIVQEAIHNAISHGKAKQISINLKEEMNTLFLTISDDGAGFSQPLERQEGMGIKIMNYRAKMIAGSLEIFRNDNGNTVVSCSLKNDPHQPYNRKVLKR